MYAFVIFDSRELYSNIPVCATLCYISERNVVLHYIYLTTTVTRYFCKLRFTFDLNMMTTETSPKSVVVFYTLKGIFSIISSFTECFECRTFIYKGIFLQNGIISSTKNAPVSTTTVTTVATNGNYYYRITVNAKMWCTSKTKDL